MRIQDTAIAFCSPMSLKSLLYVPYCGSIVEKTQEEMVSAGLPAANRIYVGSESCEHLLLMQEAALIRAMEALMADGYLISLVLPPAEEHSFDALCRFVDNVLQRALADELVLNDMGMLCWAFEHALPCKLRIGHHFDKGIREARFPVLRIKEIRDNSDLFTVPYMEQTREKQMLGGFGVVGAELDPVPGFCQQVPDTWLYAMWYPKTVLSYCTTCEFAGASRRPDRMFIPGHCGMECLNYQIVLRSVVLQQMICKSGRFVEAVTPIPLDEAYSGQGRVVWQYRTDSGSRVSS